MTTKQKYNQLLKEDAFKGIEAYQLYKYAVFLSSEDQKENSKTKRDGKTKTI